MKFAATKEDVFNRGVPPDSFLSALVAWGKYAPDEIFDVNKEPCDIMDQIKPNLGPWRSPLHRRAALMELMRVLAGFESSWGWTEGVDTSNPGSNSPETAEAGIFQISYNSRAYGNDLKRMLQTEGIEHGEQFQVITKQDHPFALEYGARLFRHTWKHNGPLYKDRRLFPDALQGSEHSVYPWLSRPAVNEFMELLA